MKQKDTPILLGVPLDLMKSFPLNNQDYLLTACVFVGRFFTK